VSDNIIEENRFGLVIQRSGDGTVAHNTFRANGKGLSFDDCEGLTVADNQVLETFRSMSGSATDLIVADNVLEGGGQLTLGGKTRFANNEWLARVYASDFYLRGEGNLAIELVGNRFFSGPLYAYGATQLSAVDNEGRAFFAGATNATVLDNRFENAIEVAAADTLELSRNATQYLEARGTQVNLRDNEMSGFADVLAAAATVTGNSAKRVMVMRRLASGLSDPNSDSRGPYLIEGNVSETVVRVGNRREPLANPVIQDNEAGTVVRAYARGDVQIRRNHTRGIIGIVSGADSRLTLTGNTSYQSPLAGILAVGATDAIIEGNTSAESQECGLATRGIRNLTITGNTLQGNPEGGLSVLVPIAGDCNSSLTVTVNELVMAVRIALEQTELALCRPADASGDEVVTIDEIILAVRGAQGLLDAREGRIDIRGNRVEDNGRFGINVFTDGTVLASENRVLRNGGVAFALQGLGAANGTAIKGNVLGSGGAEGLLLRSTDVTGVRNNVIFSNREAGILLRDAPRTAVVNNLIYANGDDGISVGLGTALPAHDVMLANNTIYANAGWGVTMGTKGAPSQRTLVINNIIDGNRHGGVAAERDSRTGLAIDFNLNNDGNDPIIPASDTEFSGDPRFVAAAGADGVLGGTGFADDDFHLQPGTPAADSGSAPAADLGITGSSIVGQESDTGVVDVGFHYGAQ
jgi:parallel beta-helix repeat protein